MTTIVQSAMTAAVPVPDLSSVETQLAVQNLRSVINNNSAYIRAVDGIADEFADSTGVRDTAYSGDNILPIMTSNTAPAGVWSASSQLNSSFHAFNVSNNLQDYWQTSSGDVVNSWLKYDFGASNEKTVIKYVFKSSGDASCAKDWTFEGSNNDSTWVVLHTVTDQVQGSTNDLTTYTFSNTTSYRYYRLNFNLTVSSTAYLNCRGLTFHEAVAGVIVSTNTTYDATGDYFSNSGENVDQVPTMTSNSAPSGTASASSENTTAQQAWKVFNDTTGDVWYAAASGAGWIKYDFGSGVTKTPVAITIQASSDPNGAPASGTFQGSNDGSSWTTLKTLSGLSWSANEIKTFTFSNTTAYRYFILNITPASGGPNVQEIEILEPGLAVNMTLISENFTAETAPTESSAVFLHQPVDSVTLNTDILGYISRDAGTTWTQGTIVDAGSFDNTTNILTMNAVDISSQPSGTSMKYKLVTANAKEQRIHGAWLAWS